MKLGISVTCPWCGKGQTLADKRADIQISCRCHNCGMVYLINFRSLTAQRASPKIKRNVREQAAHAV